MCECGVSDGALSQVFFFFLDPQSQKSSENWQGPKSGMPHFTPAYKVTCIISGRVTNQTMTKHPMRTRVRRQPASQAGKKSTWGDVTRPASRKSIPSHKTSPIVAASTSRHLIQSIPSITLLAARLIYTPDYWSGEYVFASLPCWRG